MRVSGAMTPKGFRLDIQGVRGLALVLVLLCHAEMPFAEGGFVGLDIFYVLSGFLITRLILDEIERTGTLSVLRFYARRARRLLPLAVTVLAVVVVVSLALFSRARNAEISGDVVAAGLYFVNWHLMAEAVDYFAFDDLDISPVQHYWSLSVEEQFYLVWPVLLLSVSGWAFRAGWRPRLTLGIVVAALGLVSLAYSVHFTGVDVQRAYFSTATRGWELALGGALALALPVGLRMARSISAALAGCGLATLIATTVLFDGQTPYPGWRALLPALATGAIILAGTATTMSAPVRLLSLAPFQYLGRISYAWYLWHWPALVFAAGIWGALSPMQSLAVTALAWVPTVVTHHAIEERFRRSRTLARRPRRALGLGFACTTAAVLLGISLAWLQPGVPTAPASAVHGALAIERGEPIQKTAQAVRPSPRDAKEDRGRLWNDGCLTKGKRRTSRKCVYGVRSSKTTVVLFGDSHALQYFPALNELARKHRWRLVGLTRASCPIADVNYQPTCNAWRENTLRRIETTERPDLVVVSNATDRRFRVVRAGDRIDRRSSQPVLEAGQARTLRRLRAAGASVALIRDQARAPFNVAHCVSDAIDDLESCAFRAKRPPLYAFDARGAARVKRVRVIDPMPVLCPERRCPAVIGNALVYRNTYHLTATYARTLAPWLERRLLALMRRG